MIGATSAVSVEIYRKPEKVKYYTAFATERDRAKYVDKFKVWNLIQRNITEETQKHYERLCLSVHPSAFAMTDRVSFSEDLSPTISFVEYVKCENTANFRLQFLLFVRTAFDAFSDYVGAFEKDLEFDAEKAKSLIAQFENIWKNHVGTLYKEYPELMGDDVI